MTDVEILRQQLSIINIGNPIKAWLQPRLTIDNDPISGSILLRLVIKSLDSCSTEPKLITVHLDEILFPLEVRHYVENPKAFAQKVFRFLKRTLEHELKEAFTIEGEYLYHPHPRRGKAMTQDEALKIARIISTADSGCTNCISSLVDRLNQARLGWTFCLTKSTWIERIEEFDYEKHWPLVTFVPGDGAG